MVRIQPMSCVLVSHGNYIALIRNIDIILNLLIELILRNMLSRFSDPSFGVNINRVDVSTPNDGLSLSTCSYEICEKTELKTLDL